jgi:hypothetical protein
VLQACKALLASIAGIRRDIKHLWRADTDRVVAVMAVHHERLDAGKRLPHRRGTLPGFRITRQGSHQVCD